jgi:hypothetical protein
MRSVFVIICITLISLSAYTQELQDTLSIEGLVSDTLMTDTTKLVKSVHPQDLEEAKLQIRWRGM